MYLFIPYALFAYLTSVQASTKETPFYLLYNRDPRLPIDATLSKAKEQYTNTDDYRSVLANRFLDARKLAHENIELAQQRQKSYYDQDAKETNFEIGQRVWLYTPNNNTCLSSKLTHIWHGPFCILGKKSPINYLLDAIEERNNTKIVHVNGLKPFIATDIRPTTDDLEQLELPPDTENANDNESERDPDEHVVKSILKKKISKNRSRRKETFYQIQWEDDNLEPSWEPVSNLYCPDILSEFEKIS